MRIQTTLDIARSPANVSAFLTDQHNWARLDPALIALTPRGTLAEGQAGTMTRRVSGIPVTTKWSVTELVPGSRLTMLIEGAGYQLRETTTLVSHDNGTHVTVLDELRATSVPGRLFVAISGPFIRRDLQARAKRLKELLEG